MDIGANPYETLLIPKDATASDIRKAYYKLALEFHPDKQTPSASVEDLSKCKVKFQQIGIAYAVLSDEEQRAYYDAVGEMKDQFVQSIRKVTKKDIETFAKKYKGFSEERQDVMSAYILHKGNMAKMIDHVLLASIDDEDRFTKIIQESIDAREVENFDAFSRESKASKSRRKRKAEKEAKEAKIYGEELGLGGDDTDSLKALILSRKSKLEEVVERLEEKYAKKPTPRRKTILHPPNAQ